MNLLIAKTFSHERLRQRVKDKVALKWLIDIKAFTPAVKDIVTDLTVTVYSQEKEVIYADELTCLKNSHGSEEALVRTVLISGDGQPLCFARVVISDAILSKQANAFKHLNNKPLGETLFFNKVGSYRDQFQYFHIEDARAFMNRLPQDLDDDFYPYGRRSVFHNKHGEVLVTEIFAKSIC